MLVMLVVGKTHRIGADLADQLDILLVHGRRERVADALPVLVAGDAVQRVAPAIQEEALLRIEGEAPHAEACAHLVEHRAILGQELCLSCIEVGVLESIPAVRAFEHERHIRAGARGHTCSVRIEDADLRLAASGVRTRDPGPHLDRHIPVPVMHLRHHMDARRASISKLEMRLRYHDQLHVAIDSSVEREVCLLRIHAIIDGIVDCHLELVCSPCRSQHVRGIDPEGRISTIMVGKQMSVDRHVGRGIDAAEFEPCLHGGSVEAVRDLEAAPVGAGATPVVVSSILAILGVPGMRYIDLNRFPRRACELPALVQIKTIAHCPSCLPFPDSYTSISVIPQSSESLSFSCPSASGYISVVSGVLPHCAAGIMHFCW